MDFKEELEKRVAYAEKVIYSYLPKEEGYQKKVIEAMNYSVKAGGKRLRPILMWETYQLFGGTVRETIEPFMAAIEMIHTYSLVHDDLPAMDNDEYRRGKKTTHVVYGEAMGILAGDGLLNFAFETACRSFSHNTDGDTTVEALQVLTRKPGIYGMLGGQVIDVESVNQEITMEKLEIIHKLKTSALIEASMMIGAILAGASEEEIKEIEFAARQIGLAFQIQDDILDVTSTMEVLGKPIHSDEKNNKTTYVTLIGLSKAKEQVADYTKQAMDIIKKSGRKNEFLERLIIELISRKK
ncbi:polyprenyl synthetase family protein [Velocimicrobium porci]|uniref:Farnesyl diphosphate synthase n=1 Tax=Velocimicrobium porci TaxID=2606634 RepID=A0A6L5Y0P9_9FIRM|nr:farnesyl diphosphate synthase [Velocimicrobium porci]MSS63753.1 polyprenyl synthetase family protein [Velocimicrobium porci]